MMTDHSSHSDGTNPPAFTAPKGACDCHMHIFDDAYPAAPTAVLTPPAASVFAYRALQERLGLERNVVVQPSTYGLDNRLLLGSLKSFGPSSRGIAVIDTATDDASLESLAEANVVGVRFNLVQKGATSIDMLEPVAARIGKLGWHVQVHLPPQGLLAEEARLHRLPVPLVLDHFGRAAEDPQWGAQVQAAIKRLMTGGHTWIKLSAPYLASHSGAPTFPDLRDFVHAITATFPDRIVWGTDWPHVTEAIKPNDAELMSLLATWIPDASVRAKVLVDNPATLYRYS